MGIWHAQSAEGLAREISKFAPHHTESDPPKCRAGCASDLKMSTAPQRERSERPKVTRRLRERSPGNCFVRDFRHKNGRLRSNYAVRVMKFARHGWHHLENEHPVTRPWLLVISMDDIPSSWRGTFSQELVNHLQNKHFPSSHVCNAGLTRSNFSVCGFVVSLSCIFVE